MDLGTIRQINIDNEMQASYLDYAMSVIVARALPDVRDGLKPVHRRILYAMHDLGLDPDKPYKKSARIVGEVLGKYHPHGDAAVYEAMVRMAQDFSLRYPLVDGQGNFGSIDGDNAAAMRYTEARLARISMEMLNDIEKNTVEWTDNFDGTLKEPSVLPAALPNLVVNGASGIAVGMSTNIPPHNLGEVVDALCYLIDRYAHAEEVTVEELMRFIPGPDFPTGGLIYRYQHENGANGEEQVDVIARAYAGGRGRIVVQAKAHIEDMSRNRSRIVITELPYQTNKTNLIERIAELVRDGRLEGVTDLRDESDRTGMRICIEMTRTVEPRDVLAELYKLTPLQSTFSISLLALVEGEPRLLSLKRLLLHFLEHRQEVIRRRSEHDLAKARLRKEILEGLLRALDILDDVIALIRRSRTVDAARQGLISEFKFTELQAQAILDMQLRRLAALERKKLQDEYREILALIKELEELLASPKKVLALIRKNLLELKATYDNPRRTQIADRVKGALTAMDVLPDQEVWVTLAADGTLALRPKEPADAVGLRRLVSEARAGLISANTRHDLYLFSAKGQATRVPVHQISEAGVHFADLSGFTRRDRVVAMRALPKPEADTPAMSFLLMGTAQGQVKRVNLSDLGEQAHANPQVFKLDAADELVWADMSAGGGEVMLATAQGQVIRFAEDDVRPMGLPAGGVAGIRLGRRDQVVGGMALPPGTSGDARLAMVTALGWGKQTTLAEFPVHGRGGQGVQAGRLSERTGMVAGITLLVEGEALLCLAEGGAGKLVSAAELPVMGRATQGKLLFEPAQGAQVRAVIAVTAPLPEAATREAPPRKAAPQKAAVKATGRTGAQGGVKAGQPSLLPEDKAVSRSRAPAGKTAAVTAATAKTAAARKSAATKVSAHPEETAVAPKPATVTKPAPAKKPAAPNATATSEKPAAAPKAATAKKSAPVEPPASPTKSATTTTRKPTSPAGSAKGGAATKSAPAAKPASVAGTKAASTARPAPAAEVPVKPKPAAKTSTAAVAEKSTAAPKAAPAKKPAPDDAGARVYDRSELPRVMPAPKPSTASAPDNPDKPPAKKKTTKPEA